MWQSQLISILPNTIAEIGRKRDGTLQKNRLINTRNAKPIRTALGGGSAVKFLTPFFLDLPSSFIIPVSSLKSRLLSFFLIFIFPLTHLAMAQNIDVITYNIRFNNPSDGENAWSKRSDQVIALLQFYQPDLFCLQESLIDQIEDIQNKMATMKWGGVGRDDGKRKGEFSPIFYNAEKYHPMKQGTFWLSETPAKPGLGWDAACNRVCTWIMLENDLKEHPFLVMNTHFDHMGTKARIESAKLILKKIKEINPQNFPVILAGDFNMTPEQEPIALISKELSDSRSVSKKQPYGPLGTFNGFNFDGPLKDRIDYIFVNDQVEVERYAVLSDSKDLHYPSDHLPVYVRLDLKKTETPKK